MANYIVTEVKDDWGLSFNCFEDEKVYHSIAEIKKAYPPKEETEDEYEVEDDYYLTESEAREYYFKEVFKTQVEKEIAYCEEIGKPWKEEEKDISTWTEEEKEDWFADWICDLHCESPYDRSYPINIYVVADNGCECIMSYYTVN